MTISIRYFLNGKKYPCSDFFPFDNNGVVICQLKYWFEEIGSNDLDVPWGAETLKLFGGKEFYLNQQGYVALRSGIINAWPKNWLVVAAAHGDAFVVDVDSNIGEISFTRHGMGKWTGRQVANSMDKFLASIEIWCREYFKYDSILDASCEIRKDFIVDLKKSLGAVLNSEQIEVFIDAATA